MPRFFGKGKYSDQYFPVINISKGGLCFLTDTRLKIGTSLIIKTIVPKDSIEAEILARVQWVSRNPEQSYRYKIGLAFNSYGDKKNQNPEKILLLFESLEAEYEKP